MPVVQGIGGVVGGGGFNNVGQPQSTNPNPSIAAIGNAAQPPYQNGTPIRGILTAGGTGTKLPTSALYNINGLDITGAPSQGPYTNYGLNNVWGNLQNALNGLQVQNYNVTAPSGVAATGTAAQAAPSSYTAPQGSASSYGAALGAASTAGGAAGQAALGNAAYADPTRISTAGDASFQAQQQQLANILGRQAAGGGVSPADLQLAAGTQQGLAAQLAALGSQRGETNFALANRQAADQGAAAQAQLNQNMGIQRAQETLAAQQALGGVLGTARGQAQNYNANQADLLQALNLQNAGFEQNMTLANQGAINAQTQQNVGLAQQANQFNATQGQAMTLADMLAQNNALQYNATNSQQMDLANLLATGQANQFNAAQGQAMTTADLLAQNQFGMANLENTQQMNLQNLGLAGQYGLANQQAAIAGQTQYDQQLLALLGAQGGIGEANRAAQLANQQLAVNAALQKYGIDQGVAVNQQQANANLAGAGIGAGAAVLGGLLAFSDETVKTGITGGNPMLQSFLEQYERARTGTQEGGPNHSAVDAFQKIAGMYGGSNAEASDVLTAGKDIAAGLKKAAAPATISSPDPLAYAPGVPLGQSVSDDNEKEAVMSGNRGLQQFLEQANAQTTAQNQQGSQNNAFMQTGAPMNAQVDRQMPNPNQGYGQPSLMELLSSGYGGGGIIPTGGYSSGGFNLGGMTDGGFTGAGITNMGGYSVGGVDRGATLTNPPSTGLGPMNGTATPILNPIMNTSAVGAGSPVSGNPDLQFNPPPTGLGPMAGVDTPINNPILNTSAAGAGSPVSGNPAIGLNATAPTPSPLAGVATPIQRPTLNTATAGGSSPLTNPAIASAAAPIVGPVINPAAQAINNPVFATQSLARLSDERSKVPDTQGLRDMLDGLEAHQYRYKDPSAPGAGAGTYVSPMAQELEQTDLGKDMVFAGPDGTKMVDYGKGFGTMLAGQAMLHQRVSDLEDILRRRAAA